MAPSQEKAWVGVDIGKTAHWVCVVDSEGNRLLSVKVSNDEAQITAVIATVSALAGQVEWAVDIIGAPSALLLALLDAAGQQVRYACGRVVAAMSTAFTGEGKTDMKDAYVIAETGRLRRDLTVVDTRTDVVRDLGLLTGHRIDLVADRVRMINRLRDVMTSVFPALEREFDFASCKGALVLLTGPEARCRWNCLPGGTPLRTSGSSTGRSPFGDPAASHDLREQPEPGQPKCEGR